MKRYLGNKTDLIEPILKHVGTFAKRGALVCDAFSGTLSVSLALKVAGYRVASNDINAFSAMYGRAYLANGEIPLVDLPALVGNCANTLRREADLLVAALANKDGYRFLAAADARARYVDLVAALQYLSAVTQADVASKWRRSDFFDTYCEDGARSAFVSARGRTGHRRFFSPDNARRIDAILSILRGWHRENRTSDVLHATFMCVLIDSVERVSNTQGTYHDFPRELTDPRALRPLRLEPPAYDGLLGSANHIVGDAEDSLEFVQKIPAHSVLYLDPPYNFRQYTSYYFLPNIIARYAEIDDLDNYFAAVEFVRGQNMSDDFDSPFCKSALFIDALQTLITRSRASAVVLSYFDGRNHWNEFKQGANGVGFEKLSEFFSSPIFARGSMKVEAIDRMNYQSYGGYKSRAIHEFIFTARTTSAIAAGAG